MIQEHDWITSGFCENLNNKKDQSKLGHQILEQQFHGNGNTRDPGAVPLSKKFSLKAA
jgi:hypothetical protein